MASPLCVTFAVIIIIIITSEVKTTFKVSATEGTQQNYSSVPGNRTYNLPATHCSVQYTMHYGYTRYHLWHSYAKGVRAADGTTVLSSTLRFRIRAGSDAHILLTSQTNTTISTPVYEIVLGAGRNTFSDIRRSQRTGTKSTLATPDILSPLESRGFWLRLSADGTVAVGKAGDDTPLMGWQDPEPIKVQYFSFCTWNGVFGKWEYNCSPDFDQPAITNANATCNNTPLQPAEPEEKDDQDLSDESRLRKHIFTDYDHFTIPGVNKTDVINVQVLFLPEKTQVMEMKSTVIFTGTLSLVWVDQKLKWNPENYGGIKGIVVPAGKIWTPELILYNAADGRGDNLMHSSRRMLIDSNGTVQWSHMAQMAVLCSLDLHEWPFDQQECLIELGVWGQSDKVSITAFDMEFDQTSAVEQHKTEWDLLRFMVLPGINLNFHPHFEDKFYNDVEYDEDAEEIPPSNPAVEFRLIIRRRNGIYNWTIFAPLYVVLIFIISSYWLETENSLRLTFSLISLLIILSVMMAIFLRFPGATSKTPQIIQTYSHTLLVATFAILITTMVTSIRNHKFESGPPSVVIKTICVVPSLLKNIHQVRRYPEILRRRSIYVGNEHVLLESDPAQQEEVSKPEDKEEVVQHQWKQVANAIDVLGFCATFLFCAFAY